MAPQGWAELLVWMQERSGEGKLDPEAAWQSFRALAATSSPACFELAVHFKAAPAKDRLALVRAIASVLAPVEWPEAWEDARRRLVDALGELVREIAGMLDVNDLGEEKALHMAGWNALSMARDFLRIPCRRDELRTVARLCAMGNFWCWQAVGRALVELGERAADERVVAARRRYAIAFATYAAAARAVNQACGAVVFTGLELELPETRAS